MTESKAREMLAKHYELLRESWKPYPDIKVLDAIRVAISSIDKIQQYRAIGTIEECREAMEKQKGKKEVLESYCGFNSYECPVCGADVNCRNKYCHRCGQKLEGNHDRE